MQRRTTPAFLDSANRIESVLRIQEADVIIAVHPAAGVEFVVFGESLFDRPGSCLNRTLIVLRISIQGVPDLEKVCQLVVEAKGYHECERIL